MLLKPQPLKRVSSPWVAWLTGICGGTLGGMFSASGPVLGLFGFSQPLPLAVIRATLLSSFLLVTSSRTVMVGWRGELTETVLIYVALALPVVLIGTLAWSGYGAAGERGGAEKSCVLADSGYGYLGWADGCNEWYASARLAGCTYQRTYSQARKDRCKTEDRGEIFGE